MLEQLLLFIISVFANTLSAIAGGGAGLIQLPAIIFLGLSFTTALATHKIASVALGIGASIRHAKSSRLEKELILVTILAGVPGVFIGASVIIQVPENLAKLSLGILTCALGVYSIFKPQLGQHAEPKNRHLKGYVISILAVWFFGFLNGSLTSGTGLFMTLWLIRWFGLDYKKAVAHTLVLVGLFWNSTGAVTLALQTPVRWDWLPALFTGSLLGGYLGAHLALKKGNQFIKRIFEITTIAVGLRLIMISLPL